MMIMVLTGIIRQFPSRFLKRCLISGCLMVRTDRTNLILGFNLYEIICINANENCKSSINFTGIRLCLFQSEKKRAKLNITQVIFNIIYSVRGNEFQELINIFKIKKKDSQLLQRFVLVVIFPKPYYYL